MVTSDDLAQPTKQIISGAMHYFRTLPQQWPHRLELLRALGVDCVETYVPWNLHEPRPGQYDFSGIADMEAFFAAAAEARLAVIVRPGPYICAEWDNGGLPYWLRAQSPQAPLRSSDPGFLAVVDTWFEELVPRITAHQVDQGGNIIAVQVENEFGSFGDDKDYLRHLADKLIALGVTVPLFTSDGYAAAQLEAGTLPDVLATVNFGSKPDEAFAALETHRPGEKKWCMEYWNGWFDHWGEQHHVRDPADAAATLDQILASGGSVNIYMAVGGTNFGTWAGANHEDGYQPTVTSYDYDAPISESGETTAKFFAYHDIIGKYRQVAEEIPLSAPVLPRTEVSFSESLPLWACIPADVTNADSPPSFEQLDLAHGLVWYQHRLQGQRDMAPISVDGLGDRALLFADGHELATYERGKAQKASLACEEEGGLLDVIVESMGRVNFGPMIGDSKGMTAVRHGEEELRDWAAAPFALDDISQLPWGSEVDPIHGPVFYRGRFDADAPGDGHVALPGFVKGYVWINGFCLGRYWNKGPQQTLYLPWPLVHTGENEIVVLELHPGTHGEAEIRSEPQLGPAEES